MTKSMSRYELIEPHWRQFGDRYKTSLGLSRPCVPGISLLKIYSKKFNHGCALIFMWQIQRGIYFYIWWFLSYIICTGPHSWGKRNLFLNYSKASVGLLRALPEGLWLWSQYTFSSAYAVFSLFPSMNKYYFCKRNKNNYFSSVSFYKQTIDGSWS